MNALVLQVRREFWEHRGLWIVPVAIATLMLLLAATLGHVQLQFGENDFHYSGPDPTPLAGLVALSWVVPFLLAISIQAPLYLIDCLYGERRDRSILFWRSLPVTDARTVLTKLLVGLVLAPLGAVLLAAATSLVGSAILLLRNHGLQFGGQSVIALWNAASWLRMQGTILYGLLAAMLWYAPFAAYLLLVSVWARRSPYVWALLPPLLLVILEHILFGTNYVGRVLGGEFHQLSHLAFGLGAFDGAGDIGGDSRFELHPPTPLRLLLSPRLWVGLLAAAAMILLAIRVRRYRDES
jgi:ABC-2 type transport system permease protein